MTLIDKALVDAHNDKLRADILSDCDHLGTQLARRGIDISAVQREVATFGTALPSWGVGTGGTRFARFPGLGEPRHVFDKIDDCGVIHQLTRATPTVSLHLPWDRCSDPSELKQRAEALGLGFDAVNSNTFQDQPGQTLSYKFGSLTHTDAAAGELGTEVVVVGGDVAAQLVVVRVDQGFVDEGHACSDPLSA